MFRSGLKAVTIRKKMVYAPLVQLLRGKGYSVSLAADGGIHTMVFGASGTTTTHVREAFAACLVTGSRYAAAWSEIQAILVKDTHDCMSIHLRESAKLKAASLGAVGVG